MTKSIPVYCHTKRSTKMDRGFSLLEVLVSSLVIMVLMTGVVQTFYGTSKRSYDDQIMTRANEEARTLLDYMSYDIRMAGAGVPFAQTAFSIGTASLGDAPFPILLTATSTFIQIRLNEKGINTVLSSDITLPASGSTSLGISIPLISTADFLRGDTIYLSDLTTGGTAGLKGLITYVTSTDVTINPIYTSSPTTIFKAGTTAERVATISYNSPSDWTGISRGDGASTIVLQPNTQFNLTYKDTIGNTLTLPLTSTVVKDNLSSILATIRVKSAKKLSNGSHYIASATQEISMRNLILSR